ncbi:MAG: hypothetical protein DMG13_20880 [Acidobacteria bacterium]|nr:MAG: hypothetical protein DMG13_20880 [Acidobacteriota bacterium]
MNDINRGNIVVPVLLLTMLLVSVPAFSQIERSPTTGVEQDLTQSTDFAGEWVVRNFEDQLERGLGPQLGDYLGIPFNAAGRMRAETFDAGEWSLPEFQCRPHPVPYQWRAQGAMRISKETDPVNRELIAYHFGYVRSLDRPVYMDGRPHPPEYAPHTWSGFSTAKFDGNDLVITTTHLKESYFRRTGPTFSDEAKVTEWLIRHGEFLTVVSYLEDPIYLEEPYIQSVTYLWEPHTELEYFPCTVVNENISDRVPHFLPGKNPNLKEFAEQQGIPYEATRGGAETMYPEYRSKLKNMKASK